MGWKNLAAELAEEFDDLSVPEEHWQSIGLRISGSADDRDRLAKWKAENPEAWEAIKRRYRKSPKGRASNARSTKKWQQTHPEAVAAKQRRYRESEKGRAATARALAKRKAAREAKKALTRSVESAKMGLSGGPVPV